MFFRGFPASKAVGMRPRDLLYIGALLAVGFWVAESWVDYFFFGADSVDAFDLDPRMVGEARERLAAHGLDARLWVGDATAISSADERYDAVFDFGIVHHVPDWRPVLSEVSRVLVPGGRFYAEEVLAGSSPTPSLGAFSSTPRATASSARTS